MVNLNQINSFLAPRKIAVAGASRNTKKFGGYVFSELKLKGFQLYPVNPNAEEIQGIKCYKTVAELPDDVTHLLIVTPKTETASVAQAAVKKGIKMVWIQQTSETTEALDSLEKAQIPVIFKKCIMMFAGPVKGGHAVHKFFVRAFGGYPKLVPAS
jgi:predicted CoA-binding protein